MDRTAQLAKPISGFKSLGEPYKENMMPSSLVAHPWHIWRYRKSFRIVLIPTRGTSAAKKLIRIDHTYVVMWGYLMDCLYTGPNDGRESWVILRTKSSRSGEVVEWELTHANSARTVRTARSVAGGEQSMLKLLAEEIDKCKRGVLLITSSADVLPLLRRRFIQNRVAVTFRGLRHLCIEGLVKEFFGEGYGNPAENTAENSKLWELLVTIGPLVPARALRGELL